MYDELNWLLLMSFCLLYGFCLHITNRFFKQKAWNKQKVFSLQVITMILGIVFLGIGMIFAEPNILDSGIYVKIIWVASFILIGMSVTVWGKDYENSYPLFSVTRLIFQVLILLSILPMSKYNPNLQHYRQLYSEQKVSEERTRLTLNELNLEEVLELDTQGQVKTVTKEIDEGLWNIYYYCSDSTKSNIKADIAILEVDIRGELYDQNPITTIERFGAPRFGQPINDVQNCIRVELKANGQIKIKNNQISYKETRPFEITDVRNLIHLKPGAKKHYNNMILDRGSRPYPYNDLELQVELMDFIDEDTGMSKTLETIRTTEDIEELDTIKEKNPVYYYSYVLDDQETIQALPIVSDLVVINMPKLKHTYGINNEELSLGMRPICKNPSPDTKNAFTDIYLGYKVSYGDEVVMELPLELLNESKQQGGHNEN